MVPFCRGLPLNLISTSYHVQKLKYIVVHTPSLSKPFVLNAQLAEVYFSELAINMCELKESWQQLFWET